MNEVWVKREKHERGGERVKLNVVLQTVMLGQNVGVCRLLGGAGAADVAKSVLHLHALNIVHADLKV